MAGSVGCTQGAEGESTASTDFEEPGQALTPSAGVSQSGNDDMSDEATAACGSVVAELDPAPNATKIRESLTYHREVFDALECARIEAWIDDTVWRGSMGLIGGESTIDVTPLRTKYFFGNGYTYGRGMRGREELLPLGSVDPIPTWLWNLVIEPLENRGIVPRGWVDSVVMNDYRAGSQIVAHVDPPRLFSRPIVSTSFFCPARLVFGASFDPERRTPPAHSQLLSRGSVLLLDGYAANSVTHGIRPEDLLGPRRVSMVLRHVIVESPKAALGYPQDLAKSWALVSRIQGQWRDPPCGLAGSRFYVVDGLLVTVLAPMVTPFGCHSGLPAQVDVWELLPAEDGILCNGASLEHKRVSAETLQWRYPKLPGSSKAPGAFLWLRVEN